jgi:hypothetical protein
MRAVLSEEAVRMRDPWGLKATLLISPSWPVRMAWHAPVMVLYTRELPSAEAVTSLEPVQGKEIEKKRRLKYNRTALDRLDSW